MLSNAMASFPDGSMLQIHHKREQSQDSGAYIDWNSEDSGSPNGNPDSDPKGEFVTVVSVESEANRGTDEASFVTVLEIGDDSKKNEEDVAEEVSVYRLPGERLGFGLKFEGGTNTAENVKRLFIQSSAPDSPASRAECSWGSLSEGDEIVKIDGREVKNMTRLDCVRSLKESSVVIKLYVRHGKSAADTSARNRERSSQSVNSPLVISAEVKKNVPPPPPIPPRKIPRKANPNRKDDVPPVGPPEAFSDSKQAPVPKVRGCHAEDSASKFSKDSTKPDLSDSLKRPPKRNGGLDVLHAPPEPEVYLDLLSQEDAKNYCESESDDTGSTISTVMGFSLSNPACSGFSDVRSNTGSYCDSTNPSTPTSTPSTPILDAAKLIIPYQTSDSSDFLFTKMIGDKGYDALYLDEKSSICSDDAIPLQPPLSFQDAPLSYGNEEIRATLTESIETEDEKPKNGTEEVPVSEEGGKGSTKGSANKKSSLIPRLAKSIGFLSPPKSGSKKEDDPKSRGGKKKLPPPPPPPPPRSEKVKEETEKKPLTIKEEELGQSKKTGIEDEVQTRETKEEDEEKLCWPVPELRRKVEEDSGTEKEKEEENSEGLLADSAEPTAETQLSRDPYFLFQWGSSKHLETIGEDEEDGCSEELSSGAKARPDDGAEESEELVKTSEPETDDSKDVPAIIDETENEVKNDEELVDEAPEELVNEPECASVGETKSGMVPVVSEAVGLGPPPPPFGRLPPDGHEFPQTYREEDLAKLKEESAAFQEELKSGLPPLPTSEPPVSRKYSFGLDGGDSRRSYSIREDAEDAPPGRHTRSSFWRQDEKSEKSVRDKIAMFSSASDGPVSPANSFAPGKLSKFKSSDDVFYEDEPDCGRNLPEGKLLSRSAVSIDKIGSATPRATAAKRASYGDSSTPSRSLDYSNRTQSSVDLTSSSSSAYSSSCSPDSSLSSTASSYLGYSSTLPRKSSKSETQKNEGGPKSTGLTRATSFSVHGRSQSLLDINPTPYRSRLKTEDDDQKQSSLNLLMEQRRKNLTKLRGLVIPETFPDGPRPILDLPEIKSRDLILTSKLPSVYREEIRPKWETTAQQSSSLNLSSPPWKLQSKPSPNVPKYSPAFKRKSISVYGSPVSKPVENGFKAPVKPPRCVYSSQTEPSGSRPEVPKTPETCNNYSETKKFTPEVSSGTRRTGLLGKYRSSSDAGRSEEDSDNDSAVSSSRSSMSHGFSPPSSPLLESRHHDVSDRIFPSSLLVTADKSPLIRSSSNTATGENTDDVSNRRVLKAQSVEAINRKNVLASAKYSRGFDVKSGSPLIQRKFAVRSSESEGGYVLNKEKSPDDGKESSKGETVAYSLTTDDINGKDVKIAFLNEVEEPDGESKLTKLSKTETSPDIPRAAARRASAPLPNPRWKSEEEWTRVPSEKKTVVSSGETEIKTARSHGRTETEVTPNAKLLSRDSLGNGISDKTIGIYGKLLMDVEKGRKESISGRNHSAISVNDIRKSFEKIDQSGSRKSGSPSLNFHLGSNGSHARVSSLDSTNSEDSCAFGPGHYGSSNLQREQFGSITSLASSTSLISPQELQVLIDEANQTLEESGGSTAASISHDVLVVILHRDTANSSIGITLAGGADYESKEITVHKVLTGSPADKDGRIQKGDRILSINGKSMKGVTHRESLSILKSPRPEVVLVVSRPKSEAAGETDDQSGGSSMRFGHCRPPRILEGTALGHRSEVSCEEVARGPPVSLILVKDGAGLGFSLEGGKDSPVGDRPLIIKKIFTGGAAEKCGQLKAGDEILKVNGTDVTAMSRIEAWKLMKRIPDGNVSVTVRRVVEKGGSS